MSASRVAAGAVAPRPANPLDEAGRWVRDLPVVRVAIDRPELRNAFNEQAIAELALADFGSYDLSSLRTGIMAGSICPVEVMRRCVDEMHMSEVAIAYGMTETSPGGTTLSPTLTVSSAGFGAYCSFIGVFGAAMTWTVTGTRSTVPSG